MKKRHIRRYEKRIPTLRNNRELDKHFREHFCLPVHVWEDLTKKYESEMRVFMVDMSKLTDRTAYFKPSIKEPGKWETVLTVNEER